MNKYEQLIEYIINEQEDKAKALFHSIVVEKSRDIYESLMDEEESMVRDDQVGDLVDEINADHAGMHEDDDEMGDMPPADDMPGDDMPVDDAGMGEPEGEHDEHQEIEDRVMDLEDAIDELKAEFDRLMGSEEGDHEGGEEHADHGEGDVDEDIHEAKSGESGKSGSAKSGSSGSGKKMDEAAKASGESGSAKSGASGKSGSSGSGKKPMTEAERLREYTEKVKDFYKGDNSEGNAVGAEAGSVTGETNKDSIVAGKNDMGGTTSNIVKGGSESAPDGKQYSGPKNEYSKGETKMSSEQFKNAPGNKKVWDKKETSGHGAEKKSGGEGKLVGSDGSNPVNKSGPIHGKVR